MMKQRKGMSYFWIVALASYMTFQQTPDDVRAADIVEPRYTSDGHLLLPEDFQTWIFVGSNLGLGYSDSLSVNTLLERSRQDVPRYHNVYINPEAYLVYLRNGTFPDKTMLVMDVYAAESKEPKGVVDNGTFNGARIGIEVAVKNKNRPDGELINWAYYDFTDR